MTVIAWDGKTLAADKQSTSAGYALAVTKIFRVPGGIVGFAGSVGHCMALLEWMNGSRNPANWPAPRAGEDNADAIFISERGTVYNFGVCAHGEQLESKVIASGSGRDYALAAMHLGHDARKAVEVACALDVFCGCGIDTLELA